MLIPATTPAKAAADAAMTAKQCLVNEGGDDNDEDDDLGNASGRALDYGRLCAKDCYCRSCEDT